jgi:hypothetical protein
MGWLPSGPIQRCWEFLGHINSKEISEILHKTVFQYLRDHVSSREKWEENSLKNPLPIDLTKYAIPVNRVLWNHVAEIEGKFPEFYILLKK